MARSWHIATTEFSDHETNQIRTLCPDPDTLKFRFIALWCYLIHFPKVDKVKYVGVNAWGNLWNTCTLECSTNFNRAPARTTLHATEKIVKHKTHFIKQNFCTFSNFCHILAGSFSAVSKLIFASISLTSTYAFCSMFKFYKICTVLHRSNSKF